jgi:hypothetical protein
LVRSPEENLSGQVPPQFAAEGALDHDGLEREFLRPGGNSPVTVFAGDDELLAFLHHEPHGRIVMTEIIVQAKSTTASPSYSWLKRQYGFEVAPESKVGTESACHG